MAPHIFTAPYIIICWQTLSQQWCVSTLQFKYCRPLFSAVYRHRSRGHEPRHGGDSGLRNEGKTASGSGDGELKQVRGQLHGEWKSWWQRTHAQSGYTYGWALSLLQGRHVDECVLNCQRRFMQNPTERAGKWQVFTSPHGKQWKSIHI